MHAAVGGCTRHGMPSSTTRYSTQGVGGDAILLRTPAFRPNPNPPLWRGGLALGRTAAAFHSMGIPTTPCSQPSWEANGCNGNSCSICIYMEREMELARDTYIQYDTANTWTLLSYNCACTVGGCSLSVLGELAILLGFLHKHCLGFCAVFSAIWIHRVLAKRPYVNAPMIYTTDMIWQTWIWCTCVVFTACLIHIRCIRVEEYHMLSQSCILVEYESCIFVEHVAFQR